VTGADTSAAGSSGAAVLAPPESAFRRYLPVAVLAGLSLVFLAGMVDLGWGVVFGLRIHLSDIIVAVWMSDVRTKGPTWFLELYTHLGDVLFSSLVVLALTGWLWYAKRRSYALFLFGVCASAALVNTGLKELIGRTRPAAMMAAVPVPESYSFPSGHTVIGLALGGALAIIVMLEFGTARGFLPGLAFITAGVVLGMSRVYLGVHWWSDVLGGWLLALGWLCAWSAGWLWLIVRRDDRLRRGAPKG